MSRVPNLHQQQVKDKLQGSMGSLPLLPSLFVSRKELGFITLPMYSV
jgi:hypothetical protein